MNWNYDKLNVNWYNTDNANENLRTREIVSPSGVALLRLLFG
ncbi:MAG: hypothetical protein WC764_01315 [Candidatus Paceibacterota bacterium]